MEVLSVRDYRNNLAASFDRANEGERVLIRRKNSLYALVCVGSEDMALSPSQQRQIDEVTESVRRSWKQVKQMETGEMPTKSVGLFLEKL